MGATKELPCNSRTHHQALSEIFLERHNRYHRYSCGSSCLFAGSRFGPETYNRRLFVATFVFGLFVVDRTAAVLYDTLDLLLYSGNRVSETQFLMLVGKFRRIAGAFSDHCVAIKRLFKH
jgi:hypothetical protein